MAFEGASGVGVPSIGGTNDPNQIRLTFGRGSIRYDNPFLDMTSSFLPTKIKSIFRFMAVYALSDGIISQCVIKMAEYPITKLIYNDDEKGKLKDDQTVDFWKKILEKQLDIMRILRECGMDYYAYGNSIISMNFPFRRMIKCTRCKEEHSVEAIKTKFKSYKYYAKCSNCGFEGVMEAKDIPSKELNKVKVVKWDLINIDIKYNNISDDHFYYYDIPDNIKNAVRRGDMDIVNTTRLEIIDAVRRNKQIKLMASNVYHQKRSAPQYLIPSERGWGIPIIMPVMKDVFHNRVLKKANEMIAFDHIVPLRLLFPTGTGDVSPHLTTNLSTWKDNIENELYKWRKDPNYISIVPIPLGMQSFGGDAKILMVTQELKATEDNIIIGMGVIPEIIRGGASWSGSNVSLRIVENTFINHRNDMQNIMDFIIEKIAIYFGKTKIDVKLSDFKMADDLQKKQMMVTASQGAPSDSLVSRTTIQRELDLDPQQEFENKTEELKKMVEMKVNEAEGAAEADGAAALINALYGADANMEAFKREEMHKKEMDQERNAENEEVKEQNAQEAMGEAQNLSQGQQISLPNLIYILTSRFARLAKTDPTEFKIRLLAVKQTAPRMFDEIYRNLQEMNLIEADLIPDLESVQKYTPGQIPANMQGDVTSSDTPSSAEAGLDPAQINKSNSKPNPEVKPPTSPVGAI